MFLMRLNFFSFILSASRINCSMSWLRLLKLPLSLIQNSSTFSKLCFRLQSDGIEPKMSTCNWLLRNNLFIIHLTHLLRRLASDNPTINKPRLNLHIELKFSNNEINFEAINQKRKEKKKSQIKKTSQPSFAFERF